MDERTQRIAHIQQLNKQLMEQFFALHQHIGSESPWLTNTLTMQQFKTMILVTRSQSTGTTVSTLAKLLNVSFPTMSGILERLYEHHLITRREDTTDRRITRITATEQGRLLMEALHRENAAPWLALLEQLNEQELEAIEGAIQLLFNATRRINGKTHPEPSFGAMLSLQSPQESAL